MQRLELEVTARELDGYDQWGCEYTNRAGEPMGRMFNEADPDDERAFYVVYNHEEEQIATGFVPSLILDQLGWNVVEES